MLKNKNKKDGSSSMGASILLLASFWPDSILFLTCIKLLLDA